MRWDAQRLDADDESALPGMPSIRGLLRSVQVPEFPGITLHEVLCKSALNSIPAEASMRGRPMALLRAVENLVGNAERHGEPAFALSLQRIGDTWRIEVVDHGSGLSSDAARRVRQPFVHDDNAGGTGLGLAIVDRIARQHHGELQLLPNAPRGLRAVLLLRDA